MSFFLIGKLKLSLIIEIYRNNHKSIGKDDPGTMKNNEALYEPVLSFSKQRPQMQLNLPERNPLYEEAYFSREEKCTSEYGQNTTTWD